MQDQGTRPLWWLAATMAYQKQLERQQTEAAAKEAEVRAKRANELAQRLGNLGIPIAPAAVRFDERGSFFEQAGVRFYWTTRRMYSRALVAAVRCGECDDWLFSGQIDHAADLGRFLTDPHDGQHEHWYEEDSAHPMAPPRDAAPPAPPKPPLPIADRVIAQLAELVLDEIENRQRIAELHEEEQRRAAELDERRRLEAMEELPI